MIEVRPIVPGCVIVETPGLSIMFGAPSDIVKLLIRKSISVPSHVVLPHGFFKFGLCLASVEFPLYYHLFVQKKLGKEKFTIIGDRHAVQRQHAILQQTLMGPTETQMESWGIEKPLRERTIRYHDYFQRGFSSIEEIIQAVYFEEGEARIGDVIIRTVEDNHFEVIHGDDKAAVDLSIKSRPHPYITFPPINQPIKPMKLGFINVGSYSGFDPNGDTSSLILFANYLGISIDGSPWLRERLQSLGISMDHIQLFIITHLHDDHANILDMILNDSKVTIMTTGLIFKSFIKKASAILDLPEQSVEKLTNFVELEPKRPRKWYGIEFEGFDTIHPIPTIGVRVERRIVISGDSIWGTGLEKAYNEGIIDEETRRSVEQIPMDREAEIIFMDAGGGVVHPDPLELAALPEEQKMKLILTHTSCIDHNIQELHLQSSWFGHYRVLEGESPISPIDALSLFLSPILAEAHPNWVKVFMSRGIIKQFGPNQIIFAEGTSHENFYIILNGTVRVIKGNQTITCAQAGEFFGEIGSSGDLKHSSSIISISPVELLEIDSDLFQEFLHDEGLKERFQKLGQIRPILFQTTMFKNIPERILQRIIDTTFVREYPADTSIVIQGDPADAFYLILEGSCEVIMEIDGVAREIGTLNSNDVFGEIGLLEDVKRTASIRSTTPVRALVLKKQDFEAIVKEVPGITYQLLMQAKKRRDQDGVRKS
jgi:CRP-like cAMP-binding protein